MTIFGAASAENFVETMTFPFQCLLKLAKSQNMQQIDIIAPND